MSTHVLNTSKSIQKCHTSVSKDLKRDAKKHKKKSLFATIDEQQVCRILTSLVQCYRTIVPEILELFQNLDHGAHVALTGIPDAQIRKKLRHLFYALHLTVDSTPKCQDAARHQSFKAPRDYRHHLRSFIKALLKQVAEKLEISWSSLKKPVMATNVNTPSSFPLENDKILSLMELHQKGVYKSSTLPNLNQPMDLWGKPQAEQKIMTNAQVTEGQPWRRFDRDYCFSNSAKISKEEFHRCFKQPQNSLSSRFRS
ncbi:uncharacterized protein LOC128883454 isoform X2 [Hylaeus volcanicus]|uniref:uncharacterized protein LOC128883454 isoform X2 n=1 Tax=Hylaeus volcanicus TaxID=313075 RepID=UPI0023B78E39|nr:uncharacterized protein LOC128883454 isoform X2 [Hylaeus volcanicus]